MGSERTAVVLDEHRLWLDALRRLLDEVGVEMLAGLTRSAELLPLLEQKPDLLIIDPAVGDRALGGLDCIRRSVERLPGLRVIAFGCDDAPAAVAAAFAAGAAAYVVKRASAADIAAAIRQTFERSFYLDLPAGMQPPPTRGAGEALALTQRESEILTLIAEGSRNAQVARRLWVSEQTVKFHLSNIYRKLGVANRTEASRWAQKNGLLAETIALSAGGRNRDLVRRSRGGSGAVHGTAPPGRAP